MLYAFIGVTLTAQAIFHFYSYGSGKLQNTQFALGFGNFTNRMVVSALYGVVSLVMIVALFYMRRALEECDVQELQKQRALISRAFTVVTLFFAVASLSLFIRSIQTRIAVNVETAGTIMLFVWMILDLPVIVSICSLHASTFEENEKFLRQEGSLDYDYRPLREIYANVRKSN